MVSICVRCILFLLLSVSFAVVWSEPELELPSGKDFHLETSEGRHADKRGIQDRQFHDDEVGHGGFKHYSLDAPVHNYQYHIGFQNSEKTHEYLIKHHSPNPHHSNHGSFQSEGPLKLPDFQFYQPHEPYTHADHSSFYYKPNEEHIHTVPEGIHFHYEFSKGHYPGLENYGLANFKSEFPKEYSSFDLDHKPLAEKPLSFDLHNFHTQIQHETLPQKDEKKAPSRIVKNEQNISIRQSTKNEKSAKQVNKENHEIESEHNKKTLYKPDRERQRQSKYEKSKEHSTEARNVKQDSQSKQVTSQKHNSEPIKSITTSYSENKKELLSDGSQDQLSGSPSVKYPKQEHTFREVKYQVRPSEKYDNQQNSRSKSHYSDGIQFRQTPQIEYPSRQEQTQRGKGTYKSLNSPKSPSVNIEQKDPVGEREPVNKPYSSYRDRKIQESNKYTTGKEISYNVRSTTTKPRTAETPSAYHGYTEKKVPFNFENIKPYNKGVPVKSVYPTEQIQGEGVLFTTVNKEPFGLKLPFSNPGLFNGQEAIPYHIEPDEAYSSQDETPYAAPVKITYNIEMVKQDPRTRQVYTHDENPGATAGLYESEEKTTHQRTYESKKPQHNLDGRDFRQDQKINHPDLRLRGLNTVSSGNSLKSGFHFTNSDGKSTEKDYRTYLGLDGTQGRYLEKGYRAYSSGAQFAGSDERSSGKDQRTHSLDTHLTGPHEIPTGNSEKTYASDYRLADLKGKDHETNLRFDNSQITSPEKGHRASHSDFRFGDSHGRFSGKGHNTHISEFRFAGSNGKTSGNDQRPYSSDFSFTNTDGRLEEQDQETYPPNVNFDDYNGKLTGKHHSSYSPDFRITDSEGRPQRTDLRQYTSGIRIDNSDVPSEYDSGTQLRDTSAKLFDKEQRDLPSMDLEGRLPGKRQPLKDSDVPAKGLGRIPEMAQRGYDSELNRGGRIESISKEKYTHDLDFPYRGSNGRSISKDQRMRNMQSRKPKKYYPDIDITQYGYTQDYSHHKHPLIHGGQKKRSPRSSVQYHLPNVNPGNLHQLVDLGDFFKILRETSPS